MGSSPQQRVPPRRGDPQKHLPPRRPTTTARYRNQHVLKTYRASYPLPGSPARTITVESDVPCPDTGSQCLGQSVAVSCVIHGDEACVTCTDGGVMDPSLKGTGLWLVPCGFGSAGRLAAGALTGCQGRRCVWAHDFAPALDTAGCDDNRCVVVGVPNEATPTTFKCRLGAAVSFVDQPALMAGLAAVGRVDRDERHPAGLSLIA
ncbi:MAG: hypothetical protein QOJ20_4615, partial [Mycobacterium sp.]|nr:hypothetical protein [Mycobacterium sp.]